MQDSPEGMPFSESFDIARGLNHGWSSLKRCFPVLFVGGCLKACTEGGTGSGGGGGDSGSDDERSGWLLRDLPRHVTDAWHHANTGEVPLLGSSGGIGGLEMGLIAMIVVVALGVMLALLAFRAWLVPGWIRLHRQILETGEGTFPVLFSGADRFLPMFGWMWLQSAIVLGTLAAACIPGGILVALGVSGADQTLTWAGAAVIALFALPTLVYVAAGVALGEHAITLDELGPMDALSRSWSLASGNRIHFIFYSVVMAIIRAVVGLSGICFFCVGFFITNPSATAMQNLALTEAYLLYTRRREETERWSVWTWG